MIVANGTQEKRTARMWKPVTCLLLLAAVVLIVAVVSTNVARRSYTVPSSVTVRAMGRNFQWHFTYPGPDSTIDTADDVFAERTLYLPPNVDVELLVNSDDYVYTLSLPDYGVKEIAVPDLTHTLRFHTTTSAEIDVRVDPLCGFRFYHDEIMGRIVIKDRDDFPAKYGSGV